MTESDLNIYRDGILQLEVELNQVRSRLAECTQTTANIAYNHKLGNSLINSDFSRFLNFNQSRGYVSLTLPNSLGRFATMP